MREIIFDTETTGFDPQAGDRLVAIGCIELINRVPTGATYHAYFNPQRAMPASAQAIHGLSETFLADKPLFDSCAADLLAFLGDSMLVAHNARFDFGFLNFELGRIGQPEISLDRMIDTLAIAKKLHPGAKHSLDALCTRYGIDRSHRVKHGALLDAELLAQIYIELTGGRQIGMSLTLEEEVHEGDITVSVEAQSARPVRPARPHSASPEELEVHAQFVAELNAPLWLAGTQAP